MMLPELAKPTAVSCRNCGAMGPRDLSTDGAAEDWDDRPGERRALTAGLSLGAAIGTAVMAVMVALGSRAQRQEVEAAWEAATAAEASAFERGWQAGAGLAAAAVEVQEQSRGGGAVAGEGVTP